MDAGVAAVLGAAVGVAGTLGASTLAWFSARSQLLAKHLIDYSERRRQARRDAYAAFLGNLSRVRASLRGCLDDLRQRSPDLSAIVDRLEESQGQAVLDDSFLYVVMLEGPAKVAEIASGAMEALDAMNGLIRNIAIACKKEQIPQRLNV
jgi:hypothetical protein